MMIGDMYGSSGSGTTSYPLELPKFDEGKASRRKQLEGMEREREFRRSMVVAGNEEVKKITSDIEANNITILKLQHANDMLCEGRNAYIKEVSDEFDVENPQSKELSDIRNVEVAQLGNIQWGNTSTHIYPTVGPTVGQTQQTISVQGNTHINGNITHTGTYTNTLQL